MELLGEFHFEAFDGVLEDLDGFSIFGLDHEEYAFFEFGEGFGEVAPVWVLFHGEGDVDRHLVAAVEPADDGGEGNVDDEEYEEKVEDVGEEDLHPRNIDEDECVHEDAEIHESEEIDEVGSVSRAKVSPTTLEKTFFRGHS